MSFLNFAKPDPRALDIASRRSTPNSLDSSTAQEIGEVNQILEHHFAHNQPSTEHLDFGRIRDLVANAPAPPPWYASPLMAPGHLAGLTAAAALLYVGFAVIPVATRSEPGLQAIVYEQPTQVLAPSHPESLGTPAIVPASAPASNHAGGKTTRTLKWTGTAGHGQFGVTEPTSEMRQIKIIKSSLSDEGGREILEQLRQLNAESEDGMQYRGQIQDTQQTRQMTLIQALIHQFHEGGTQTINVEQTIGPDGQVHIEVNGQPATAGSLDPAAFGELLTGIEQVTTRAELEALIAKQMAADEAAAQDTEASEDATTSSE